MNKFYFFLDETGDHSLSFIDKNYPIFLLCGCLFSEKELQKLTDKINKFKIDFFKSSNAILHSREIRKCEGSFQILFDEKIKKDFYLKLNKIIFGSEFTIIGAGVKKEKHIKKYGKGAKDPYAISLAFIIERLIFCLDNQNNSTAEIFMERRGKKEDQKLLDQYNTILDRGTYFVKPSRIKEKIKKFEFYYKSENINGLQIADLCAYPIARHILSSSTLYPAFEVIKNKIYCNKEGKLAGYGLKMFP